MKDQWLSNSCQGDPIKFLKYLDVETYESVAESALEVLLSEGLIMPTDVESIQQYILSADGEARGLLKSGLYLHKFVVSAYLIYSYTCIR